MSMSKIFTLILTIATSISLISCAQKVQQFDPSRLDNSIRENDFTLVYFYSSSYQYMLHVDVSIASNSLLNLNK